MPRQNRVTPFGEIVATPEHGEFMGNRGCLHNDAGRIVRSWKERRWIVCEREFNGRKRELMKPKCYTELFFLDEVTALAAGHRPCWECRRERYWAFCTAWPLRFKNAAELNQQLHADRLNPDGSKKVHDAVLDDLPDGVFVVAGDPSKACLLWNGRLLVWSPAGYRDPRPALKGQRVTVLTPKPTVAAIRAGYRPHVDETAIAEA